MLGSRTLITKQTKHTTRRSMDTMPPCVGIAIRQNHDLFAHTAAHHQQLPCSRPLSANPAEFADKFPSHFLHLDAGPGFKFSFFPRLNGCRYVVLEVCFEGVKSYGPVK